MATSLTYPQLLEVLRQHVSGRSSGTLYIRTDCNHAVSFALDSGRIYAVYYGPRRGRNALNSISGITGGTCHFESLQLSTAPQDLPSTPEILGLISVAREDRTGSPLEAGKAADTEQKTRVCFELKQLLRNYLGPIADMVFEDALAENEHYCTTHESARMLIDRLADDIEDSAETAQFSQRANAIVNRIL